MLFQEAGEEFLSAVLRRVMILSAAANVGVKRIPIGLTELGQRVGGLR